MKRLILAMLVLFLAAEPAEAAIVQLIIKWSSQTGEVNFYAKVQGNDNAGLALFGLALENVQDLVLRVPQVALSEAHAMQPAGFTQFRMTDPSSFGASQDLLQPASGQVYGVGQAPGVLSGFPAAGIPDVPYDYPVLLGTGKLTGNGPWDRRHPENLAVVTNATANVYEALGSTKVKPAGVGFGPEPSSFILAALGLAAATPYVWRRRRAKAR
ncbi:MAG: PEP-CTERM sorting domain-containing protein [Pirellulales bacterium]